MSNQDKIKVSVCVVTYNQEEYIGECLQSLVDQETSFPFEIIVGEDCSTDKTREVVEEFALKYPDLIVRNYHEKNVGAVENVITTYKMARGEYLCHIDGDDGALPGKLQAQATYLDDHPGCCVIWSRSKIVNPANNVIVDDLLDKIVSRGWKFSENDLVLIGSVACHSSKMFKKETLNNIIIPEGDFLDFYLDVCQVGQGYGYILKDFYCFYRASIGVASSGTTKKLFISDLERLVKIYPGCSAHASAQFLKIFLLGIKNRSFNEKALFLFIKSFRLSTPILFFKSIKLLRAFRSPL